MRIERNKHGKIVRHAATCEVCNRPIQLLDLTSRRRCENHQADGLEPMAAAILDTVAADVEFQAELLTQTLGELNQAAG